MQNSNCSSTNYSNATNQNNNLIKYPLYKYNISKAKLNYKMMNKSIKSQKQNLNNNKNYQNNKNIKKIDDNTTIVLNTKSRQQIEINNSKTKSESVSKEKEKNKSYNIQNSKNKNIKVNNISSNSATMYNNNIKQKEEINKKTKHKNQITNICLKKGTNGKWIHYNNIKTSSSFSNNNTKLSQIDLKKLNKIPKNIYLNSYKTTPKTVCQSRKNSKEKNNIQKNNFIPSSSKSKSKSTSITKINNITIPINNNNIKNILNKYSGTSNLTSQSLNNNDSNNEINDKKNERNITKLSKSYYQKIKEERRNKKVEKLKNVKTQNSSKYNKYYYEKVNINLFPINNSSHNTIKSESKSKSELNTKNKSIKKSITNTKNNIFIYNIQLKKKDLTGNNTKILNKLNNNNTNNNSINRHKLSSTLTKIDKKEKKQKSKKPITQSLLYDITKIKKIDINKKKKKEDNSLSISLTSSIKDLNYYKNESKKLSEKIKNYYIKNKEYPETTIEYYKIGRSIGHGGFGKVNLSLHILSGRIVAIKSINKKKGIYSKKNILYEIKLMKKLRGHKNVVKLFEKFENKNYTFIVMENIIGGNLLQTVKKMTKLTENQSKNIFKQLIETLKYIHSKNIVHRDIKPHNILLTLDNQIKICDFGVGKEITKGTLVNETCGTPAYIAPELLYNKPFDPFKSDIWSCGVVLYFMLTGFVPFKGDNDNELHNNIIKGIYPFIDNISLECNDLIKNILEVNPDKRFNLNDILNHAWLKDFDLKKNNFDLFTKAEKIIYGKLNIDYRFNEKEKLVENFTYKNLESEFDSENKNIDSTSYIITPNNTEINPYYNDDEEIYFSDLMIKDKIMKFNLKVRELNLNYEVKYNADVDQGFLRNEKKNKIMRSLNNSINEIDKKLKDNNFDDNNINNLNKEENDIEDEKYNDKKNKLNEKNNFNINENALKFVEDFGYNKEYIIKSLLNNDLNHCTATYYLKISLLEE